jgi:hypothetical protein
MTRRDWSVGIVAVVLALFSGACASSHHTVRLYSVDTGAPSLELHYEGDRAWIGEQRAPACQGEHRILGEDLFGSYEWAELTCKDGRVIECTFELSELTKQGAGTCLDNEQHRYRVLF